MKKIKKIINMIFGIIFCISIIFLVYLVKVYEPKKNSQFLESRRKLIEKIGKKYIDQGRVQNSQFISVSEILKDINDSNLITKINKFELNGCFKVSKEITYEYYDIPCSSVKIENNQFNDPIIFNNGIPVRYNNGKYISSSNIDWYDYEKKQFAYLAFVKNDYVKSENVVLSENQIEHIFVWIPTFYYNEILNVFSYRNIFSTNLNSHYEHTTRTHLPFAFYYKNRELYGFWIQIDKNKFSLPFSNTSNYDLHYANQYNIDALTIFQEHYQINLFDNITTNNIIISIGKGAFFNEKP